MLSNNKERLIHLYPTSIWKAVGIDTLKGLKKKKNTHELENSLKEKENKDPEV